MVKFSNLTSISTNDSRRLESSFFQPPPRKRIKNKNNKPLYIIVCSLIALSILAVIFLINYNIIIVPQYTEIFRNSRNLLDENILASANLLNPTVNSKITKDFIYLDIPFNKETGFSLNLKERMDLSNSEIIIVTKNPKNGFTSYAVLRDISFFSNSRKPIEIEIKNLNPESDYVEIPIETTGVDLSSGLNLLRINQLRFMFYQKESSSLPLLVKKVIVHKKSGAPRTKVRGSSPALRRAEPSEAEPITHSSTD